MKHEMENQPMALARREELVVQEMPDEVLVYDLRQHEAHCLNKAAAFIWDHCDGQTTIADLTKLMSEEFESSVDESLVWHTLDRLSRAMLLAEKIEPPRGIKFRSRRAMLSKLGTAAMLSIPLVTTMLAPTAAQAATIPDACTGCAKNTGTNPLVCDTECVSGGFSGGCWSNSSCDQGGGNFLGCYTCSACSALVASGPCSEPGCIVTPARSWRAGYAPCPN